MGFQHTSRTFDHTHIPNDDHGAWCSYGDDANRSSTTILHRMVVGNVRKVEPMHGQVSSSQQRHIVICNPESIEGPTNRVATVEPDSLM